MELTYFISTLGLFSLGMAYLCYCRHYSYDVLNAWIGLRNNALDGSFNPLGGVVGYSDDGENRIVFFFHFQ